MINGLIKVMKSEKASALDKSKKCAKEEATNEKNLAEKKDGHEQLRTLVRKNGDAVGALSTQLDEANAQVKALQKSDDELAKLRKDAKVAYEKGSKDRGIALKVLKQARSILKKTFASLLETSSTSTSVSVESESTSSESGENVSHKVSFLQIALSKNAKALKAAVTVKKAVKALTLSKTRSKAAAGASKAAVTSKKAEAHTSAKHAEAHKQKQTAGALLSPAVELVGQIVDDLSREQKMAGAAEEKEVKQYAAQLLEFRKELDLKMETVRELAERKGRMEVKRDNSQADKDSSSEKLKAAAAQLRALKSECGAFMKDFKEQQVKLQFQMGQLRDAHAILSGASLMQVDSAENASLLQTTAKTTRAAGSLPDQLHDLDDIAHSLA